MSSTAGHPAAPRPHRRWWPWLRRALTVAFLGLTAALLVTQARRIDWDEVFGVLREFPAQRIAAAAAFAALAHAAYGSYDLLGRAWTRHGVATLKVVTITFVSYAFNLNFGTWVGGFAFRLRLYSRFGLGVETISRVVGLSVATNWLGYLALGGAVFAAGIVLPPADWHVAPAAVQQLGVGMLAAAALYLLVCGTARRREWTVRGHVIALPPLRLALVQLALSSLHWASVGAVLFVLLPGHLSYLTVLGTLLIAAVAGVIAHIPAGLGVLEAVFIALLGTRVPQGPLLASLLAYRALYYLVPLGAACGVYLLLEARARQERAGAAGTPLAASTHPPA